MARVGGKNPADLIAGYRGGYTPLERKEIERKMTEGELTGLVSTNALELGIDIGKLDATVIVGYPGTKGVLLATEWTCRTKRQCLCQLSDPGK